MREETGYRAGRIHKLLDFYGHPGHVAHKVHPFAAYDLDWGPLELEEWEEIRALTFRLSEALETALIDYRCDPEAALALWLYTRNILSFKFMISADNN